MKTEEEILKVAYIVLKDLFQEHFDPGNIISIRHQMETLSRGKNKGEKRECWTVTLLEPISDSMQFLVLSNEGEPLYMQTSWTIILEIEINDGMYKFK